MVTRRLASRMHGLWRCRICEHRAELGEGFHDNEIRCRTSKPPKKGTAKV
jgi:hypothetical protein